MSKTVNHSKIVLFQRLSCSSVSRFLFMKAIFCKLFVLVGAAGFIRCRSPTRCAWGFESLNITLPLYRRSFARLRLRSNPLLRGFNPRRHNKKRTAHGHPFFIGRSSGIYSLSLTHSLRLGLFRLESLNITLSLYRRSFARLRLRSNPLSREFNPRRHNKKRTAHGHPFFIGRSSGI